MDFKWLPGKVGVPVIAPPPEPTPGAEPARPFAGIIVPPAVDTALRGVHSTWEGTFAALIVGALTLSGVHLPLVAKAVITGLLTGAAAVVRSLVAHQTGAKPKAP